MKLDVEGYEPQVIAGARATLRALPPAAILAEYTPGLTLKPNPNPYPDPSPNANPNPNPNQVHAGRRGAPPPVGDHGEVP